MSGLVNEKYKSVISGIESGKFTTHVDLSNCDLVEFPQELFALVDTLEHLNLGNNFISMLPSEIKCFTKLRVLFFGQNRFTYIPSILGELQSLMMISFKSNKVGYIEEGALRPSITWLILSDNLITELPASIGLLSGLRKCMLAGNKLSSLPDSMQNCKDIELLRISANNLTELPQWLFTLPKLSWLAYAGNPLMTLTERQLASHGLTDSVPVTTSSTDAANSEHKEDSILNIPYHDLLLGERIGEGASGYVHKAVWTHGVNVQEVAMKLFKGETTSDGLPLHEMKASEAVGVHPSFIQVLGRISESPHNQMGLVFPLLDIEQYKILGNPPSFDSVTRDTFPQGQTFSLTFILQCLQDIASGTEHLHRTSHLIHGDLYAHNILTTRDGHALLTDFGAASFKTSDYFNFVELRSLENIEIRAFGCLIDDLLAHIEPEVLNVEKTVFSFAARTTDKSAISDEGKAKSEHCMQVLSRLRDNCMDKDVRRRPNICMVHSILSELHV